MGESFDIGLPLLATVLQMKAMRNKVKYHRVLTDADGNVEVQDISDSPIEQPRGTTRQERRLADRKARRRMTDPHTLRR